MLVTFFELRRVAPDDEALPFDDGTRGVELNCSVTIVGREEDHAVVVHSSLHHTVTKNSIHT